MKTLYWLGGAVLAFGIILTIALSRMPGANIVGVSKSSGAGYSEVVVLYRGGTFEQFITDSKTSKVSFNKGTWGDPANDEAARSLMAHTGMNGKGYINLKNKVDFGSKYESEASLEYRSSYQPPQDGDIQKIESLRRVASPSSNQ